MKKILFILACLVCFASANGQERVIKKPFQTSICYWYGNIDRDTTLYVSYFFNEKGKLKEVHIDCVNSDKNAEYGYFMCADSNIRNFINLREALIGIKGKFEEWSKIAADNNVDKYAKAFGDYGEKLMFHRIINVKRKGVYTSMFGGIKSPYIDLTPVFNITKYQDKIYTSIGTGITSGNVFCYKDPGGYVPSLWSQLLTSASDADKEILEAHQSGLRFFNLKNLESFIDALDFLSAKKEYDASVNKKKNYDDLFK